VSEKPSPFPASWCHRRGAYVATPPSSPNLALSEVEGFVGEGDWGATHTPFSDTLSNASVKFFVDL